MFKTKPEGPPPGGGARHAHVRSDPRSHKLDRIFFKRVWTLCRPYWVRKEAWPSLAVLIAILSSGSLSALAGGGLSLIYKQITDALVDKHVGDYWRLFFIWSAWSMAIYAGDLATQYASGRLRLDWRRWLTSHLMGDYLAQRTYYEITMSEDIDNPDQRIQEEVEPFTTGMSDIPKQIFNTSLAISVQVVILMSISVPMLLATLTYVAANALVTVLVTRPTIKQNWDMTVAEADLRYGLLHVRDNAETIAFYGGERMEQADLADRLDTAVRAQTRIIRYQVITSFVDQGKSIAWSILPMMLLAPLFFRGEISYGTIALGVAASQSINASLNDIIRFVPQLTQLAPHAVRLAEIQEKFERLSHARRSTVAIPRIDRRIGPHVDVRDCALCTPGGEQSLIKNLSFVVTKGDHLLIVGQTGIGKSSLLRAMAGLWTRGTGTITAPADDSIMFLPQRPYMMLGSLRNQITYPSHEGARRPTDQELTDLLTAVRLPTLARTHGGLDAQEDWGRILSLGEQQRIAIARVLLAHPDYIFMDEATSALDLDTEKHLYGLLLASTVTMISVGHRPSLVDHHKNVLDLRADGWRLMSSDAYARSQSAAPQKRKYGPQAASGEGPYWWNVSVGKV